MYKRPKISETDEDILRLQEVFVKNQLNSEFKPAACVTSQSSNSRLLPISDGLEVSQNVSAIEYHLDNTFEDVPTSLHIGSVVERKYPPKVSAPSSFARDGFPRPRRRSTPLPRDPLHSQRTEKSTSTSKNDITANISTSNILNEVNMENIEAIRRMKPEEIAERKQEIIATCDPALIAFLKNRRQELQKKSFEATENKAHLEPAASGSNDEQFAIADCSTLQDIVNEDMFEKWMHLDVVEAHKLAWMKDADFQLAKLSENYEARFDFSGWLLPYSFDKITEENRSLFHHGSEPQRPGYTLQELLHLCRSSVLQQRRIALSTIAQILSTFSYGVYDSVLELPIEQIFFVIRMCADDNTPATLLPSIRALRNLITNDIEEGCLDCLFAFGLGFRHPNLGVDDQRDDPTLNDQQLVERNLCKCFLRTGILDRIRYIITIMKPSERGIITNCIDILIRLARDSDYVSLAIWNCSDLLNCLLEHFLPIQINGIVDWKKLYGTPLAQVLKLFRLLSIRAKEIQWKLKTKYQMLIRVGSYLSNESIPMNTSGVKLQIECFRFLEAFYDPDLCFEEILSLEPVLFRLLHFHYTSTKVDASCLLQTHASSLIIAIMRIIRHSNDCQTLLFNKAFPMWMQQFQQTAVFQCDKLQILSSCLHVFASFWEPFSETCGFVSDFIKSDAFTKATANLSSSSNYLNHYRVHKSSANLLRTECLVWEATEHVVPVLQSTSALPFLFSLSEFVCSYPDKLSKFSFLNHKNVKLYMESLRNSKQLNVSQNWYNRVETGLISNLLKISLQVYESLDPLFIYELAAKSVCSFHFETRNDLQFILTHIIFNKVFFPNELRFAQISLQQSEDEFSRIYKMYENVLGLTETHNESRIVKLQSKYTLPVDWIFSPIISLYSTRNEETRDESTTFVYVLNCLRWIHICESHCPQLLQTIDATAKFTRLLCVFLCSDSLFLHDLVGNLLSKLLQYILNQHEAELDFDQEIQGLNNFHDLYIQLLEQYQSVSYGNKVFGQFLMIPLAQRHNSKLRKALWSEYAGVTQILRLTAEELFCDINSFKSPIETDTSLLQCYQMFLKSGRDRNCHSALYEIAAHHVRNYNSRQES